MPQEKLVYTPLPTAAKFIRSDSFYSVICGPRGSGKTSAAFIRTIIRAQNTNSRYYPLRWAVVRDTRKNIGLTIARTIKHWWPTALWRGKPEEPESCTLIVDRKPFITYDFFGVNSPADHDRFQSYEASGGVWIEEPCPFATNTESVVSGIAESVLSASVTCLRSAPSPSVQVPMNPPSADHWTAQLWHLPGYEAAGDTTADLPEAQRLARENIRRNSTVLMTPPGECAAEIETPGYTERNRQILLATGRTDLLARLVEGRVGYASVGTRVTPEFNGSHLAAGLRVIPNIPIILSFDFGLDPSCLASQISPQGYLLIHKAWTRSNAGMKQLLQQDVHPWLAQQPVERWWYCGGPEAREREQSDSEETALKMIVTTLGNARYQACPVSWSDRREAMHDALERTPGGIPWIRIDPVGAAMLVRALDGAWYYVTDALGRVRNEDVPFKGKFSHIGDAFAALCAVVLHRTEKPRQNKTASRIHHISAPRSLVGSSRTLT